LELQVQHRSTLGEFFGNPINFLVLVYMRKSFTEFHLAIGQSKAKTLLSLAKQPHGLAGLCPPM